MPGLSDGAEVGASSMTPRFDDTVSALTYSSIRDRSDAPESLSSARANRVVSYVLARHACLPDVIRLPLRLATLLLDASTLPTTGRPFHLLPHAQRRRRIERWRRSRIGLLRSLLRFYEGLAIFGWYGEIHDDPI